MNMVVNQSKFSQKILKPSLKFHQSEHDCIWEQIWMGCVYKDHGPPPWIKRECRSNEFFTLILLNPK